MSVCSHITNKTASVKVRTFPADFRVHFPHNRNMARRGVPKGPVNWYLVEWMAACGMSGRGAQAKMMKLTGWSKATMSQLYNGEQDYSPKVVNEAAVALNVQPWELLMPPEKAQAIQQFQKQALQVGKTSQEAEDALAATGTNG